MHELTKDLEFRLYFSDRPAGPRWRPGFQWLAEVRQVSTGLWVAHGWGDAPSTATAKCWVSLAEWKNPSGKSPGRAQ